MYTVEIGVTDLAATRFAVSPLAETIAAVQVLADPGWSALNLPWFRWAQRKLEQRKLEQRPLELPRLGPLVVGDRPSWPEFLAPAPASRWPDFTEQLARMQETTAEQVRASLRRVFGDGPWPDSATELARQPQVALAGLAKELAAVHDQLIAPHWERIRGVLDADIVYRAGLLAEGGAGQLLNGLHEDLRWEAGQLTLASQRTRKVALGPGGLVLVPTVFGWPGAALKMTTTTQTTLRYPARGIAALWQAAGPAVAPAAAAAERLLGVPRARLLSALRSPATTTDLARSLGVTPSAVSQHLAVLSASGLVGRQRTGRSVLYVISSLGLDLLDQRALADSKRS
jgi:DNA-binding transcriptional ArsR family regulator